MPDPTGRTISASQVAGLFNRSPYVTKWMLYHHFKEGLPIEADENDRMSAGKYMESGILAWTADELHLDVWHNEHQVYSVHADYPVGCTKDAEIRDPNLGPGIVEAKNVDFIVYKTEWDADHAPPHIEIQLQAQMLVTGAKWGVIAALVGGNDLKLYRRLPNEELQQAIVSEAIQFFEDLDKDNEPDALGDAMELPGLTWLYPETTPGKIVSFDDMGQMEVVENYLHHSKERLAHDKLEKAMKAKLLELGQDAEIVNVPGYEVMIRKTEQKPTVVACPHCGEDVTTRKGFTKTTIKTRSNTL